MTLEEILRLTDDITPQELRDLLQSHISGGQMVLDPAWLENLRPILGALGVTTLTLNPVNDPTLEGRTVTLTGTGSFLGVSNAVTLVAFVPINGPLQIYLAGARNGTSPAWKFGDSFKTLPDYTMFDGQSIVQKPSYFFGLTIDEATFISADFHGTTANDLLFDAGLNLTGKLQINGPIESLNFIIPPEDPPLNLSGSLVLHGAKPPDVSLRAAIPSLSFQLLGTLKLDPVFLWMRVINASDPADSASRISVAAEIAVGSLPPMIIAAELLQGDFVWTFEARPATRGFLKGGLQELSQLVGGSMSWLQLPDEVLQIADFDLESASFGIVPETRDISFLSIALSTPPGKDWLPPLPKLRVTDIRIEWTIYDPATSPSATGAVQGLLTLGDVDPTKLLVQATMPDFTLSIDLAYDSTIDVPKIIQHFLGPVSGLPKFTITQLYAWANVGERAFGLNSAIDLGWTIVIIPGTLELGLEQLFLNISYTPVTLSGDISASLKLLDKDFTVSAEYPGSGEGWIFSGSMNAGQEITLRDLATKFLQREVELPSGLDLALTKLAATVRTKNCTYDFAVAIRWRPDLEGFPLHELNAELAIKTDRPTCQAPAVFSGHVQCDFLIGTLKILIRYSFEPESKTLVFEIGPATATLVKKGTGPKAETILTIKFGDLSLGEIITYLVNLADPSAGFKLTAPWNVLNSINLKGLNLEVNLTTYAVGISYKFEPELNLVLLSVQQIGLTYVQRNGKGTVDIKIGCRFLEKTYDYGKDPLEWDLLNDPPPAVPGKGPQLLDIQYLGFGQHVTLANIRQLGSVKAVIDQLANAAVPVDDPQRALPPGIVFDGQSQWLVGAQFTVLGTVALSFVFNDPNLYGLLISLSGEKAQKFAGLSFEILYKKVTEDIGLYHIELKLPDAMRQLEFGSVSVTLPIVTLDIYTNGNFRVDFGFPVGLDFSRSFSVQAFPFVGFGGFYFALLNGATSDRVPRIDNGTFSPVIEFGLGLSLGLGKTIDKGVLSAGLTVTVIGVFEGVIGWFHPDSAAVPSDRFYLLEGTVAIVGKLFGKVDFGIISAAVSVTAYASVSFRIQAYKAIVIKLQAGVSVSVRIKVLFITISFSFSMQLEETFTIGSDSRAPWHEIPPATLSSRRSKRQLRAQRSLYRALPAAPVSLLAADINWNWDPPKFWDTPHPLAMMLAPTFTVAGGQYLFPPGPGSPAIQAAMQLFLENSVDPSAKRNAEVRRVSGAADQPFNTLALGAFWWALHARLGRYQGEVTASDLDQLQQELAKDAVVRDAFRWSRLDAFLENFQLNIVAPPPTAALMKGVEDQQGGSVFPMLPVLAYTKPDGTKVRFGDAPKTGADYQAKVAAYFQQLLPDPNRDVARDPLSAVGDEPWPRRKLLAEDPDETLATMVFRDYFAMLAKSMVHGALTAMAKYSCDLQSPRKLDDIAAEFGVTSESILSANQTSSKLQPGTALTLTGVLYQVRSGDSLASIAQRFPTVTPVSLAAFGENPSATLFQAGATLLLNSIRYTVVAGDTIDFVASFLSVRNGQQVADPAYDWLRQTIVSLNLPKGVDFSVEPLPPGTVLDIPVIQGRQSPAQYTSRLHDTLDLIAGYFTVLQLNLVDPVFLAKLKQKYPVIQPGQQLEIPPMIHTASASDSFQSIFTLLNNPVAATATANANTERLLAQLAVLEVPPIALQLSGAERIADLANRFNLTLEELAAAAGGTALFAPGQQLVIQNAQKIDIATLTTTMLETGEYNNVSATVSRFLLHGLRVPDPDDADFQKATVDEILRGTQIFKIYSLYDRIGQQFTVQGDSIDITFEKTGAQRWIAFDGDPDQPNLDVSMLDIGGEFPSTTFAPHPVPALSPFVIDTPNRYGLEQVIHWQTADPPRFPSAAPAAGEPTVWPASDTLLRKLQNATALGLPFGLYTMPADAVRGAKPTEVALYEWATIVQFQITRNSGDDAAPMPNSYLILGADQDNRELLRQVWTGFRKESLLLYLLYAPNPSEANPSGLATDQLNRTGSFQIKTNLSTLTHSGPQLRAGLAAPASGEYFATLEPSGSADFIRLLWEASVVGTGGFYLNYSMLTGEGLPDHVFDEDGRAMLRLLIVHPGQGSTAHPFNNCAVVGDNIDVSAVRVFAQKLIAPWSPEVDDSPAPLFPAGDAGFKLRRPDPDPEQGVANLSSIDKTAVLYNLLSYQLSVSGSKNPLSRQGIPVGPNEQDPDATGGLPLPALLAAAPAFWDYQHVIPVYRVVAGTNVEDAPPLPSVKENPYAGIDRKLALDLDFAFYEVYGNRLDPTLNPGESMSIGFTLGYFDDLTPVLQWPGFGASYRFTPGVAGAQLSIAAAMQLSAYAPGAGTALSAAVAAASSDALKYRNIYYQVEQSDVKFTLAASVNQLSLKNPYVVPDRRPFTNLAAGAYVYLSSAREMKPTAYTTAPDSAETLAAVAGTVSVAPDALLAANAGLTSSTIFSGGMQVPKYHVYRHGDTFESISQSVSVPVQALGNLNRDLPLIPGTVMGVVPRTIHAPSGADDTLAKIAGLELCTPAGIAVANQIEPGIFTIDAPFKVQGVVIRATGDDSFVTLRNKFNETLMGITVDAVAAENQKLENIFKESAAIAIDEYIVQPGDTLGSIAAQGKYGTFDQLVDLNQALPNLYEAGTPILYAVSTVAPGAETLAEVIVNNGVTYAQFAAFNASTAIAGSATLTIPDLASFDPGNHQLYAPYRIGALDSLLSSAGRFGTTAPALGELNRYVHGMLAAGKTITLGQPPKPYTIQPSDTLGSVFDFFRGYSGIDTYAAFVELIAGLAILHEGSLLFSPLPQLPQPMSLADVASALHIDAVQDLATANRGLLRFLNPGATVTVRTASLRVKPYDTLSTLVFRFKTEKQIDTNLDEIVGENATKPELVASGNRFLVPPSRVQTSLTVTPGFPGNIFEVTVALGIARDPALLAKGVNPASAAAKVASAIAPDAQAGGENTQSLTRFALDFEAAFKGLKAATGKSGIASANSRKQNQIWAVNFGTGGINVATGKQPVNYFGILPLSNQLISRNDVPIAPYPH